MQGDVGAWRTRHLRLVGCEVSGWHTRHVKGAELPADGLTKLELFVNQIAMKEDRCYHLTQVQQPERQDEDDWTIMRGALAVLLAAALFVSGAEPQIVDLVALALMLAGVTWLRKIQKNGIGKMNHRWGDLLPRQVGPP